MTFKLLSVIKFINILFFVGKGNEKNKNQHPDTP